MGEIIKNIALLGGNGYLGAGLQKALVGIHNVTVIDFPYDFRKLQSSDFSVFDAVINLAIMNLPAIQDTEANSKLLDVNGVSIFGLITSLGKCKKPPTYIHFSTREVIGKTFKENDVYINSEGNFRPNWGFSEETVVEPNNIFGKSKLIGEIIAQSYEKAFILRLGTPYTNEFTARGGLISKLIANGRNSTSMSIPNGGRQFRDPLHTDDIAHFLNVIINESNSPYGTYHLGGTHDIISLNEIVRLANKNIKIDSKPGPDFGFSYDCTKAIKMFGWSPKVNLKDVLNLHFNQPPN
jgi:nucleoside-diphosphate-sugar epimerase